MKRGPGRPKGSANKITTDIRKTIANAFEKAGGETYLVQVAKTDPKTFLTLLGKIVPAELHATVIRASSQLTDDELAAIATGSSEDVASTAHDTGLTH